MTTATGTASGHNDLIHKLHDFLITAGWTELAYSGVPSPLADSSVLSFVLRAPGGSSGNEFFLYMNSAADVGNGYYGLRINAAIDYDSTLLIGGQKMISPDTYLNLWQNSMDYWFYANGRRVVIVAKVNTSYVSAYLGCFLPFALPSQYTKPFTIIAPASTLHKYDRSVTQNRFVADPGNGCAYYLNRSFNQWIAVANHEVGVSEVNFSFNPSAIMWPHRSVRHSVNADEAGDIGSWSYGGLARIRPPLSGEVPQFLCHILSLSERKFVGALDGVYSVPGFNRTSEQLVTFGSPASNFRTFQNIFRTTARDFMAIEEV